MAPAAFGEVHVSLFVAGAVFGQMWNIAGAGNVVIFKNLLLGSAKRSLGGAAGCGLRFHGRIILGSFSDRALWKCDFNHFP